jgi:hypothetical protein
MKERKTHELVAEGFSPQVAIRQASMMYCNWCLSFPNVSIIHQNATVVNQTYHSRCSNFIAIIWIVYTEE